MYRRGRPVDSHFEPTEKLYRRCQGDHIVGDRVLPQAFRAPDFSVNRGKYSQPEDVLMPSYERWGVVSFQVKDVPARILSAGGAKFEFGIVHDPEEDNYSHSEVRAYKNGGADPKLFDPKLKLARTAKKEFRQRPSDAAGVLKPPEL